MTYASDWLGLLADNGQFLIRKTHTYVRKTKPYLLIFYLKIAFVAEKCLIVLSCKILTEENLVGFSSND